MKSLQRIWWLIYVRGTHTWETCSTKWIISVCFVWAQLLSTFSQTTAISDIVDWWPDHLLTQMSAHDPNIQSHVTTNRPQRCSMQVNFYLYPFEYCDKYVWLKRLHNWILLDMFGRGDVKMSAMSPSTVGGPSTNLILVLSPLKNCLQKNWCPLL